HVERDLAKYDAAPVAARGEHLRNIRSCDEPMRAWIATSVAGSGAEGAEISKESRACGLDDLFDHLAAGAADRRRADRGTIAVVEVRGTAELQGIGDELGACPPPGPAPAGEVDGLIGEINRPVNVLRRPAGERVVRARRRSA